MSNMIRIWTCQITVSFDETTTLEDVDKLFKVFSCGKPVRINIPPFLKMFEILYLVCQFNFVTVFIAIF